MNIGALQSIVSMPASAGNVPQLTQAGASQAFGTVFSGFLAGSAPVGVKPADSLPSIQPGTIEAIFQADDLQTLGQAFSELQNGAEEAVMEKLDGALNVSLKDIAGTFSKEPEKLLGQLKDLLEEAGVSDERINQFDGSVPVWTLLSLIDEVAPKFFEDLTASLTGEKMKLSQQDATAILSMLKSIDLIAPKTDMTLQMEQKLASFQTFMNTAAEQFGEKMAKVENGKLEKKLAHKTFTNTHLANLINTVESQPIAISNSSQNTPNNMEVILKQNGLKQDDTSEPVILDTQAGKPNADPSSKSADSSVSLGTVHSGNQTAKAEFTLQETPQTSRSETLMRELQTLFKRSNFGQAGGSNRLLVKLYPEHLGQVRIELHESNGIMTARILASSLQAKEMLDSQMHQLRHALSQQNLQVERIDIAQSIQETSKNEREQSFNDQFKREQQQEEGKQGDSSETETSFEEYLIELEV